MSVSGINFSGLSSGIDTDSIIQKLLSIDRQPQDLLKTQQTRLQAQQTAYQTVSASLLNLQASTFSLDKLRAFDIVTTNVADNTVATVTSDTGAQTGTHSLTVANLAQAQRISTAGQSSQTAPLGSDGQVIINNKAISYKSSDTIVTLANNINAAQIGVTAAIISPSPNTYYLTLSSNNSGVQGQINISDAGTGNVLSSALSLFGAGYTLKNSVNATTAGSNLFTDTATSVATLQGQTAVPPTVGNVQITATVGGVPTTQTVAIDLSKSLSGIEADINAAFGNPATPVAQIVAVTDPLTNTTKQQLQISGVAGAGAFVDDKHVLANLGVLQQNLGTDPITGNSLELQAAKDAKFNIDGLDATRPTNSFSDALSGVTINLLKDTGTTTFTISADTSTIKSNIQAFVKAFNDTIDTVDGLSQFDSQTGKTGPLFGDSATQSLVNALVTQATDQVTGAPTSISLLSQAGITLDQSDHLQINDAALSSALSGNLQGVAQLFRAFGTPSDPNVQFVSSTGDTQPSGPTGYEVRITQPATQAIVTASTALGAGTLQQDEVLTFAGPVFGTAINPPLLTGGYTVTLRQGRSLDDIISQINGDATLNKVLTAGKSGGALQLVSKSYGAGALFAVTSGIPAAAGTSSGIGTAVAQGQGVDVHGTINGETATGNGQFLTGSQKGANGAGNGRALGLQLRVSATTADPNVGTVYGNVLFTSGVADIVKNYITQQTDQYSGVLTSAANSINDQLTDIQTQISDMDTQLSDEEQQLRQKFSDMEVAIANIKSASAGLAALGVTITTGSSSSSH